MELGLYSLKWKKLQGDQMELFKTTKGIDNKKRKTDPIGSN